MAVAKGGKAGGTKKAKTSAAKKPEKKKAAATKKAAPKKKAAAKAAPAKKKKVAAPRKATPRAAAVRKKAAPAPAPVVQRAPPPPPAAPPALPPTTTSGLLPAYAPPVPKVQVPPADYQPSGAELSSVRAALKQLANAIINGRTITRDDITHLRQELLLGAGPTGMEAWLLWRSYMANMEQFTVDAALDTRHFLTALGVTHHH